jgi:hypothetical protein
VPVFGQVSLGFHGGVNNSKLSGTTTAMGSYQLSPGFVVGMNFSTIISEKKGLAVFVNPDLVQHNTKFVYADSTSENERDSLDIKGLFAAIPIGFKVTTENKRFYAFGDLELGVLLSYKGYQRGDIIDLRDETNPVYVSAQFGLGVNFYVKKATIFFEIIYSQGITNISSPESVSYRYLPRVRMKSFRLYGGVTFPISFKKKNSSN